MERRESPFLKSLRKDRSPEPPQTIIRANVPPYPAWMRWLGIGLFVVVLLWGTAELTFRIVTRVDGNGNEYFGDTRLKPYRLPVASVSWSAIAARQDDSYLIADPELGWTIRPDTELGDGFYTSGQLGNRKNRSAGPIGIRAPRGRKRVLFLGDDLTHGTDVHYEESWPTLAAHALTVAGRPTQVVNLAVPGYGVDQALLRWRKRGRELRPSLVVLGHQPDATLVSLSLVREIIRPGVGYPYSKPRFVLAGADLQLVNSPAEGPDELVKRLIDFERWQWARYEFYYDPADYRSTPLRMSRFLSFLEAKANQPRDVQTLDMYSPSTIGGALSTAIIDTLAEEVEAAGGELVIVALPNMGSFIHPDVESGFSALLVDLDMRHKVIDAKGALETLGGVQAIRDLYGARGHYTAAAHAAIGELVAARLREPGGS